MKKPSFTIPKIRRCGHCVHFRTVLPDKAVNVEKQNRGGWCMVNEITTAPGLLRCGGDDYERIRR